MHSSDHKYLHAFNAITGIGAQKLRLLLAHFGDGEKAWQGSLDDYLSAGLAEKLAAAIAKEKENINPDNEWEKLQKEGITIVTKYDETFPQQLTRIPNPPLFLYIRGSAEILNQPSVAIVGSRKFSTYGKQAATRLAYDLATAGVHVVSGLALGIDALAHRGALETTDGGTTIGVLGGSIDDASIAPRAHSALAHAILAHGGALISEYAPPTTPNKGTFPARNRIMAGMSSATLVIEAGENSGTLITAGLAADFERPLFAVPGSIFARESVGTNNLIASEHAHIVQRAEDILDALHITKRTSTAKNAAPSSPEEDKIYTLLAAHPDGLAIDKIIRHTTLEGTTVGSTLVLMELHDLVTNLGGGLYAVKK